MSSIPLLVENLTKTFFPPRRFFLFKPKTVPFQAVKKISFQLGQGEILGILGANGAGKTTTLEMLLGILKPTCGQIQYFGRDFQKEAAKVMQDVTYASAYYKLPAPLSVQENLEIFGRLYGIKSPHLQSRINLFLKQFGMEEYRNKQTGKLSAGQMTRVCLIKAFLPQPKIVLLDEPTASLDPDIAFEVRSFILNQQKEHGVSVILTSHNMQEVASMCDRVLVMQKGAIIKEGTPASLAKSVSLTKITLTSLKSHQPMIAYLEKQKWKCTSQDNRIKVEIDETEVPLLLKMLAKEELDYTHIEIDKPSLEDYFLSLTLGN